jgi:hypothetical protein
MSGYWTPSEGGTLIARKGGATTHRRFLASFSSLFFLLIFLGPPRLPDGSGATDATEVGFQDAPVNQVFRILRNYQ